MIYQFNFSFSFSLLLMGFLFANIFGIITSGQYILFFFILCIEIINYFIYFDVLATQSDTRAQPSFLPPFRFFLLRKFKNQKTKQSIILLLIINSLNFLKIGFEFGFFMDAFKLGS